jgi:hypothetical protein
MGIFAPAVTPAEDTRTTLQPPSPEATACSASGPGCSADTRTQPTRSGSAIRQPQQPAQGNHAHSQRDIGEMIRAFGHDDGSTYSPPGPIARNSGPGRRPRTSNQTCKHRTGQTSGRSVRNTLHITAVSQLIRLREAQMDQQTLRHKREVSQVEVSEFRPAKSARESQHHNRAIAQPARCASIHQPANLPKLFNGECALLIWRFAPQSAGSVSTSGGPPD